ncbi:MAG TPA: Veg family protein [Symbiobacteriaceae bacterium]
MAPKSILADIKKDLDSYVGEKIRLKANKGRKKILEREGVLESTYPNIFIVKLEEADSERRVSYSYADLLTEAVELVVCSSGGQETKIEAHSR